MTGKVFAIYIAQTGQSPISQPAAQVESEKGLVGDRYYQDEGTFSEKLAGNRKREITFIAKEEIDRFNDSLGESLGYGEVRRNVVTEGVELATLIGREFSIGTAKFLGIQRCEPCAHLAATVNEKVLPHLAHTGLRAAIIKSGTIEVGQSVD